MAKVPGAESRDAIPAKEGVLRHPCAPTDKENGTLTDDRIMALYVTDFTPDEVDLTDKLHHPEARLRGPECESICVVYHNVTTGEKTKARSHKVTDGKKEPTGTSKGPDGEVPSDADGADTRSVPKDTLKVNAHHPEQPPGGT